MDTGSLVSFGGMDGYGFVDNEPRLAARIAMTERASKLCDIAGYCY